MGIEKLNIDLIGRLLERILSFNILFNDYILSTKNIQKNNNPVKVTEYDFVFVSDIKNRWMFIRIEDFFTYQKLIIWINQINDKKPINFDVLSYFLSELDLKNIKQKMIFKAKSEIELEKIIESIFEFIVNNSDEKLKGIFEGKIWIDTPFDWGDYK
ncbi:MAG: hypothetical protein SGJ10_02385 [Bacteroidota bacterium]|nr:hypothetical protein [Bacteroidota bacterium]